MYPITLNRQIKYSKGKAGEQDVKWGAMRLFSNLMNGRPAEIFSFILVQ